MPDQNRIPGTGIGIGRGRGILKNLNKIPNSERNENNDIVKALSIDGISNCENFDNEDINEMSNDSAITKDETKTVPNKVCVNTLYGQCSNNEENYETRPPRVNFIPNDDIEDYKLRVNSGIHFDKFEDVIVKVTGDNIPKSISILSEITMPQFLVENVKKLGYKTLTPVQKYTIPIIASGRDVMSCAETGSGKTCAFLLPIINSINNLIFDPPCERNAPHCIIMVPSRELCRQVYTAAAGLCYGSSIKCAYGYGGVEMNTSLKKIVACDILCVTPGRLVQYVNSDLIMLNRLSFFVLDEADRLLGIDEFLEAVRLILSSARELNNRELQISMFSATFPRCIQNLAQDLLKNYLFVAVGIVGAANADIEQKLIPASASTKLDITLEYIANHKLGKTLIFVKRKRLADFYGIRLIEMGLKATTIHGDRQQSEREQALNDFKSGRVDVLVATDVASRGLDIPNVDTVLNVDMPDDVDVYVHRIGRSGRCGNPGSAVTFFDVEEDYYQAPRLIQILRGSKQPCPSFLTDIGSGFKVRNTLKSSTKDLRSNIKRDNKPFVCDTFMNMQEDSDEELVE